MGVKKEAINNIRCDHYLRRDSDRDNNNDNDDICVWMY